MIAVRPLLYRRDDKLVDIASAFRAVSPHAVVTIIQPRCVCGDGGCWDCCKDELEYRYVIGDGWRACSCGEIDCIVCQFYLYLMGVTENEPY